MNPALWTQTSSFYAFDTEAPQHLASRDLPEAGRARQAALYVTSQVLCEFYAIVTNPHRVAKERSAADAVEAISGLLVFLHVLPIPGRTVEGWLDMLRSRPVTGGAVFDLEIASAMLANSSTSLKPGACAVPTI